MTKRAWTKQEAIDFILKHAHNSVFTMYALGDESYLIEAELDTLIATRRYAHPFFCDLGYFPN